MVCCINFISLWVTLFISPLFALSNHRHWIIDEESQKYAHYKYKHATQYNIATVTRFGSVITVTNVIIPERIASIWNEIITRRAPLTITYNQYTC